MRWGCASQGWDNITFFRQSEMKWGFWNKQKWKHNNGEEKKATLKYTLHKNEKLPPPKISAVLFPNFYSYHLQQPSKQIPCREKTAGSTDTNSPDEKTPEDKQRKRSWPEQHRVIIYLENTVSRQLSNTELDTFESRWYNSVNATQEFLS